jgi:DNA primase large subunit
MENDMMGGPFISYSQVDTKKNLVVVVEGFVYAPKKEKRELIRELEASLMTLQLDEKQ